MSKSILVIEKSDVCCQCRFSGSDGDVCCLEDKLISEQEYFDKKPDWCPLKDVPEKKEVRNFCIGVGDFGQQGYQQGWNACIDEILGIYQ